MVKEKVGDILSTKSFGQCEIIEIVNSSRVLVKFLNTGYSSYFSAGNIRNGLIKDPTAKNVSGVGYLGVGKYLCRNKTADGMKTSEYACWEALMKRIYNPDKTLNNNPYKDIKVCSEWHNFQNFAEWCQSQIGFGKMGWNIDKDILLKENKEYSPESCCFVPQHINSAITGAKYHNTSGCAGVELTEIGMFSVRITMNSRAISFGVYETFEQAVFVYTSMKEAYIKTLAEVYKDQLATNVYDKLMKWKVDGYTII